MNSNHQNANNTIPSMVWYKVPILWLMISLLGFTVISGVYLFLLAHDTNDTIVSNQQYTPLDKKQALPGSTSNIKN